jgi:hypothetical protein
VGLVAAFVGDGLLVGEGCQGPEEQKVPPGSDRQQGRGLCEVQVMERNQPKGQRVACGGDRGVYEVHVTERKYGQLVAQTPDQHGVEGLRFNDGKASPEGVLVVGRMHAKWREGYRGRLYKSGSPHTLEPCPASVPGLVCFFSVRSSCFVCICACVRACVRVVRAYLS